MATGQDLHTVSLRLKFHHQFDTLQRRILSDLPLSSSGLSKSPLGSAPAAPPPRRRRCFLGSKLDQAAAARDISRSRSSSRVTVARAWSSDDIQKLCDLKEDKTARPSWKTIAGKVGPQHRGLQDAVETSERRLPETSFLFPYRSTRIFNLGPLERQRQHHFRWLAFAKKLSLPLFFDLIL